MTMLGLNGKQIEKHCAVCDKSVRRVISMGYWIDDNLYCNGFSCDTCGADLCEEDRRVLENARKHGKEIVKIMY